MKAQNGKNYPPDLGIGAPAADLAAIVSGIGDVLHALARALPSRERLRLLDLPDVLIVHVGINDPRATVPKALLAVLEEPLPRTWRVLDGGKSTAPARPGAG